MNILVAEIIAMYKAAGVCDIFTKIFRALSNHIIL